MSYTVVLREAKTEAASLVEVSPCHIVIDADVGNAIYDGNIYVLPAITASTTSTTILENVRDEINK